MSVLGRPVSAETRARISAGVIASWKARIEGGCFIPRKSDQSELAYAHRYHLKVAEVHALKKEAEQRRMLDAAWARGHGGATVIEGVLVVGSDVRVNTHGSCLPASGVMVWKGGGYALVWWDGSDAPMVWPCADLEVAVK